MPAEQASVGGLATTTPIRPRSVFEVGRPTRSMLRRQAKRDWRHNRALESTLAKQRWAAAMERPNTKLRREVVLLSGQNGNQNHRTSMVACLIQRILVRSPINTGIGKLARRQAIW